MRGTNFILQVKSPNRYDNTNFLSKILLLLVTDEVPRSFISLGYFRCYSRLPIPLYRRISRVRDVSRLFFDQQREIQDKSDNNTNIVMEKRKGWREREKESVKKGMKF